MEGFERLPKPGVTYYGSAAAAMRRGEPPLIDLVELKASHSHYSFVASVPAVHSLPGGGHDVECDFDTHESRVYIVTKTTPGSLLVDSSKVHNRRRVQLYPHGPCGISFALPGPVDPTTVEIFLRSMTVVEFRLRME